ncbi:hypothetical protein [Finegoldia magna]|uniref:Putative membrane protein n=1 Tax=Finegoldia magna (strain ATCC 29328 / DSM 20472 / WAL 2508) TaxID=334413 RepID=B0RZJ2_FINM2|nr:hypothetical protein [Finegoldia magna]MSB17207.1 hypothetical protein [Finegoldia magna]MSD46014.1 hypothetical protein [Finegoldia magna]UEA69462.1 hypothetical protein LK415_04530 [Finegoldia magna]BAG07565.1 putative membrane protein [Finegoldia magna ATCC 29328]
MKNLQNYRKEIARRISLLVVFCVIALLAIVLGADFLKDISPKTTDRTDYVLGFFTGIELVCVFYMGCLIRAYRDEKYLKEMYTKETDEREILIRMKSGKNIVPILSLVIAVIACVMSYVNYEVFIALTAVAIAQIIITLILKIYWSQKL